MTGPAWRGLICPADPSHGRLLDIGNRLRCVHADHDGRPRSHPKGPAPATRAVFTLAEVEAAR